MKCNTEDCTNAAYARSLCKKCYQRFRRANVQDRPCAECQEIGRLEARGLCGPCYRRARRLEDPATVEADRERVRRYRARLNADPEKRAAMLEKQRADNLQRNYGITVDQYEAQYAEQAGACALCFELWETLYVDHCHDSGTVRGLLCRDCNFALGQFKDRTDVMARALVYVETGGVWNV